VAAAGQIFRFGRFELDAGRRRLTRDGENFFVPDRPLDALIVLVKNRGRFVSKHTIVEEAWRGIAVTDNAVVQAIKALRELLGSKTENRAYIETKARHGYRFVMPVEDARRENLSTDIKELFECDREFVTARAAVKTMDRTAVEKSRRLFTGILTAEPDNVPAKIGMEMARFLDFESTRVDSSPDTNILLEAERHLREACSTDPRSPAPL
jgi:DNA-binding winged helix-turn-helix (wHTH) protein